MRRVISYVFRTWCMLWPVCSLNKTLLVFALLHFVVLGQTCLLLQVSLDFLLLHSSPLWWKGYLFHCRGLQCKSRKSRDTWSNRQVWPWSKKWSRAKATMVLPREHTGHSKHPLPTTEEMTLHIDITRWSIPKSGWLYSLQPKMEKLDTVTKNKTKSWLWVRSWTPYCQIQT